MSKYYVYQLRLENSKLPFYIGKGCGNRRNVHLMQCSLKRPSHKNHTILKAMRDGVRVVVEIIHQNLTNAEAVELEMSEIRNRGRMDNGTGYLTNHTDGGDGTPGHIKSEDHRRKISMANRGKVRTAEQRLTYSKASRGRKLSPEHVERIRKMNTGRKASDETKAKMKATRVGKKRPEHGPKVRAALSGVQHTEERKENQKFAQWDRNPAWLNAEAVYDKWVETGKPGLIRLQKHFQEFSLGSMHAAFNSGWNPANDPSWIKYKSRINHVG